MSLNQTIADLIVEGGRAKASGVLGAGQAYGSALKNIGQTVAQLPQVIEGAKESADKDRARAARNAFSKAMKDAKPLEQDGLSLYNIEGIGKAMTDQGYGAEFAPAAEQLTGINQSMLQFQQGRMNVVKTGATALLQSGADPDLTFHFLDTLKSNQVYDPATIESWKAKIRSNPDAAKQLMSYLAGPQKIENAAAGSMARNAVTGEVIEGSKVPEKEEKPTEASLALIANDQTKPPKERDAAAAALKALQAPAMAARENTAEAQAETAKHNREMEKIALLGAGKAEAAQAEIARHNRAMEENARNTKTSRPLTSGDANKIADYDTSLNDLTTLRSAVKDPGTISRIQSSLPTWVSELTGGWTDDAKQQNAVIARVRQVIGKALEGGVLRKEDEEKYKQILPVIGDSKAVALDKIEGLEKALTQRRQTELTALEDAGYDVSKFRARDAAKPPQSATSSKTVRMRAPNGQEQDVPASDVEHFKSRGAKVVK